MLQNNTYICWQHDVRLETMLNREKLRGNLYPEWTLKKLEKGHLSLFHVRNCNVPTLSKCTPVLCISPNVLQMYSKIASMKALA